MTTRNEETRQCRLCGKVKVLDLFENDKRVIGGKTSRCRVCKAGLNDRASTALASMKQRAARHGAEVEVTIEQINTLYEAFDGLCIYCGKSEEGEERRHAIDHVIPISRGGTSHISNLVLACNSCNASKNDKPLATFYIDQKETGIFPGENFVVVEQFLALMSGTPVIELRQSLLMEHAKWTTGRLFEQLDKQSELEGVS
ncbi:HNH endonuclease [Sporosarcina sp. ACRSL]|uniref:HNH endonuclease n=1 Tax=Sporosarcina sp. ACRSL TaxID=2918215 RepID=UPI001EF73772|nr:HNH endonuclease signature motif containing protein [Sporosarcina sp. ACRSL]MCG7346389.1 HNH endonuclease [Sporosarcina sp. ACRSL]